MLRNWEIASVAPAIPAFEINISFVNKYLAFALLAIYTILYIWGVGILETLFRRFQLLPRRKPMEV
jgi:hypothetical protein